MAAKSRLPRTSIGGGRSGGGGRLSLVPSSRVAQDKNENVTPTHAQGRIGAAAGPPGSVASSTTGYSRRTRRQTSNG